MPVRLRRLFTTEAGGGTLLVLATVIALIWVNSTRYAPEAPTLMGALNLAALNLANALGAIGVSITLSAGLGTLSTAWAGLALTSAGLLLFAVTVPRFKRPRMVDEVPTVD